MYSLYLRLRVGSHTPEFRAIFGYSRFSFRRISRDQAYFKTVFFSGDRPGDLGQVKVVEILHFPNDDGFLFNHIWG